MKFTNGNTKTWECKGLITSYHRGFPQFIKRKLTVRYTSDKNGKSLSIGDDLSGVLFQVPFEYILSEIEKGES